MLEEFKDRSPIHQYELVPRSLPGRARRVQPGIIYECFMSFCNTKNFFFFFFPELVSRGCYVKGVSHSHLAERKMKLPP